MIVTYDIEVFPNFFSYAAIDINTKKKFFYYLHENTNQIKELLIHLNEVKGMIGFNNLNYDSKILFSINKNSINEQIYNLSKSIINNEKIKYIKTKIPQLDLFKIWHFDNKARRTSLKDVEMALNWWNLQSLPLPPDYIVQEIDIPKIKDYNFNDVESTLEFYLITKGITENPLYKGIDKIDLRNNIEKEFNIKCLNTNDVSIGGKITEKYYSNISKKQYSEFKNLKTYRTIINLSECIPNYISFKTKTLINLLNEIKNKTIKSNESFKKKLKIGNTKYLLAKGGLHSDDKARLLDNSKCVLKDADVASLYPSLILNLKIYPQHLGIEWLEGYKEIYKQRLHAKKLKKDPKYKNIDQTLKLSLNGSYGKFNEEYSWMYDPLCTFKTTIAGQLSLLMLIEMLELENIQVISANTDGVVCLINDIDKYNNICKSWESITNLELEFTDYYKLIQTSVNDYIAIKTNNDIKFKGVFEINKEIHKNHSQRIVPIALANYFINNIPVQETIQNHLNIAEYTFGKTVIKSHGIFDYCLYVKAQSNQYYTLQTLKNMLFKTERLLKNNRYIITKDGGELIKNYTDNREERCNVGYLCTLANIITKDSKFDINYNYYINECNKIIKDKIEFVKEKRHSQRKIIKKNKQVNSTQLKLF